MRGRYAGRDTSIIGADSSPIPAPSRIPVVPLVLGGLTVIAAVVAYQDFHTKVTRDPGPASSERYVSYYDRPGYTGPRPARI